MSSWFQMQQFSKIPVLKDFIYKIAGNPTHSGVYTGGGGTGLKI